MEKDLKKKLKELDFSDNEISVYLALTKLGESPASKIAKKADLPRTTVISILENLEKNNYLSIQKYKGLTYYWIESPKAIKAQLLNKVKLAEELDGMLTELYRAEADFPGAQIYDTVSGIKKFVENLLNSLDKKTVIYTIDSPGNNNYLKIFSENFSDIMIDLKNKKSIATRSLIPSGAFQGINKRKLASQNIILREMPEAINFNSSLWIINDLLVLFSGRYPFVVATKHKIITESLKSVYDFIWAQSRQMN
jgi:sugar-specific transcriptional regulator TrmB